MKCLVTEISPERINAKPVTNEDGTPHVYATISEARAELKANGYSYNRANDRYYIKGTEYRAYIIREGSEEYAEAIAQAQRETFARNHIVKYISREGAEELHAIRFEKALSWYELAQRYGITEHQARKAYSIIHYNKTRAFEYDTEAERNTADAATDYDPETAAKHAAEAEQAAEAAEQAAAEAEQAERSGDKSAAADASQRAATYAQRASAASLEAYYLSGKDEDAPAYQAAEEAAQAANRAADRAIEAFYAVPFAAAPYLIYEDDPATDTAENRAAEDAANALISAYADAIGEYPAENDTEFVAAYRVAAEDIAQAAPATDQQRATVADMIEAIVKQAERIAAERIAPDSMEEYGNYEDALNYVAYTVYALMTGERMPDAPEDFERLDRIMGYAAEIIPAEPYPYQRQELEAYLGSAIDSYDVDAIEAEATEHDPKTGRAMWTPEAVRDLWPICARHELKA